MSTPSTIACAPTSCWPRHSGSSPEESGRRKPPGARRRRRPPPDVELSPELTDLRIERLRERRSAKWTYYEPDVLPSFVAEMDFPLAPPIKQALHRAVDLDDTGYANPEATSVAANLAAFVKKRMGWDLDPD